MDREDPFARRKGVAAEHQADDAVVRLAYELATKPPTKDVASIKAASDVYEANVEKEKRPKLQPRRRSPNR